LASEIAWTRFNTGLIATQLELTSSSKNKTNSQLLPLLREQFSARLQVEGGTKDCEALVLWDALAMHAPDAGAVFRALAPGPAVAKRGA